MEPVIHKPLIHFTFFETILNESRYMQEPKRVFFRIFHEIVNPFKDKN